jgi:outer membrane receptor protein involved in Fe transport
VKVYKSWDISLATDFQWNTLQANLKNFAKPERYTTLVALATSFDIWRVKMQANILGTFINDRTVETLRATSLQTKPQNKYTPAVILSCKPIKKEAFTINAFYKRSFRMPTFNDLYYTDIGNTSLQPEMVTQYNAGLQ